MCNDAQLARDMAKVCMYVCMCVIQKHVSTCMIIIDLQFI